MSMETAGRTIGDMTMSRNEQRPNGRAREGKKVGGVGSEEHGAGLQKAFWGECVGIGGNWDSYRG